MYSLVLIGYDVVLFQLEKEDKGKKSLPKEETNKEMTSKKNFFNSARLI